MTNDPTYMKSIIYSILFWMAFVSGMQSQSLSAFVDGRGYFIVFDNGNSTTLSYQAPASFKVGGSCIAFQDFNDNFRVYYNGNDTTLYSGPVNKYIVTHNLVFYTIGGLLKVFDRGKVKTLSSYPGDYSVGDSLVAFYDNTYKAFYVYYDHDMFTLENTFGQYPILNFQASNNTLAYQNNVRDFKIYWNGGVQKISNFSTAYDLKYQTGSNIVAFTGNIDMGLYAFYKGQIFTLSTLAVTFYDTGDDMIAYSDQNGVHVFYAGRIVDMGPTIDATYDVADSIMYYYSPGYFKVFNKGKITVLENYKPDEIAIDNNTLVYLNQQGGLRAFYDDKTYDLSTFEHANFIITGNTVWFKTQSGPHRVFLKGKIYDQ